jgi:hypothetical protein
MNQCSKQEKKEERKRAEDGTFLLPPLEARFPLRAGYAHANVRTF